VQTRGKGFRKRKSLQTIAGRVGQLRLKQIIDVGSVVRKGVSFAARPAAQGGEGSGPPQLQPTAAAAATQIQRNCLHRFEIRPVRVDVIRKIRYLLETAGVCQMPIGRRRLTLMGDSGTSAPGVKTLVPDDATTA
jgi:hypothetical protein